MTLHNTAVLMKKGSIFSAIGIGVIIMIVIFFKIGVIINNIINPPKIEAANQAYGKIPPLEFPESTVKGSFTYTIDTLTAALPELPDRIIVYPVVNAPPNLLNLDTTKKKIDALGFSDLSGTALPEIPRGGTTYEWDEPDGLQRKIIFDIVSQNFQMSSDYLTSLTVLSGRSITDAETALIAAQGFMGSIDSFPKDIDVDKTKQPDPTLNYVTKPQLFSISGGELVPSTSISKTQVIRVDFFQKDVTYTLSAGKENNLANFQDFELKLPILYPHPPYSTMNALVASGNTGLDVVAANYTHQTINFDPRMDQGQELPPATYPIKTATEAFDELKKGDAYIAAYNGTDSQILVNNIYLAYYLGEKTQQYLMPIIVFEGPKGFFAYISAVEDTALE